MEVQNKKGGILSNHLALFLVMLILLDSSFSCGAAVLVKSNSSFRCDDRLEECMIAEDLELDFLMNPCVSRILADPPTGPTPLEANKPAVPCGHPGDPYGNCINIQDQNKKKCSCTGSPYCRQNSCPP